MTSESRRYAELILATRDRDFEGRHPIDESIERLRESLSDDHPDLGADGVVIETRNVRFEGRWEQGERGMRLKGRFLPPVTARFHLMAMSAILLVMAFASYRALTQEGGDPARYIIVVFTVLSALFGMPMFIYGKGSMRDGDESRIERAIRVALEDLDPKMPPPQKWKDED